ncbi:MAG TPA: alpha/beta fold hydrolase [Burkholderiales bacterium]|nr:alpha/beta fold hydrolase [Burkholderiales bacterium]
MSTSSQSPARARPLEEVKAETIRRAGHWNPLDGIDPEAGKTVAGALTSLDRDEWAREWSKLGARADEAAAKAEQAGDRKKAHDHYLLAFNYFRIARYPCPVSHTTQKAYEQSLSAFRKASRYFDPPLEIVEIPCEGRTLIGYLQVPRGIEKPPVIMSWGGVDGWKEDRTKAHPLFHAAGFAGFAIDMPGTGEHPFKYTDPKADRAFTAFIDYLLTRKDIDATRLGVWGGSYGAYWAAKLAHTEHARIRGAVFHGGNVHHGFQPQWMKPALTERAKAAIFGPVQLFESRSRAMGVASLEEFLEVAPKLSLLTQGLLDGPSAPLLCVNGKLDDQAPVDDCYVLMEHGNPKEARIYPNGGHMGRGGGTNDEEIWQMIVGWLKKRVAG